MSKTIEEVAKSIAKSFIKEHKSRINNDAPLTLECVQYVIERIFALPLSSRLTAEEKERVRKIYVAARDGYWDECNDMNIAVESVLEGIFGADFFKEE